MLCAFEKNVYFVTFGWNVLYSSVKTIWPYVLCKADVFLLIFYPDDISSNESKVLTYLKIIALLSVSPFRSINIYFI